MPSDSGQSLIIQRTPKRYNPKKRDCLSFPGTDATNAKELAVRSEVIAHGRTVQTQVNRPSIRYEISRPIVPAQLPRRHSRPGQREKARDCLLFPGTDATNANAVVIHQTIDPRGGAVTVKPARKRQVPFETDPQMLALTIGRVSSPPGQREKEK